MSPQLRTPEPQPPKLSRDDLSALLRDVTEQRDRLLEQYEAMAFQVDESTRDVDDALMDARRNAGKAEQEQRLAEEEAALIEQLSTELKKERRAKAELAAECARFRDAVANAPVEDPWGALGRAASQIIRNAIGWARARIAPDSRWLPIFDRTIDLIHQAALLTVQWSKTIFNWAAPRVVDASVWLKDEIARRRAR